MHTYELTSRTSLAEKISLAMALAGAIVGVLACVAYFALLAA